MISNNIHMDNFVPPTCVLYGEAVIARVKNEKEINREDVKAYFSMTKWYILTYL